MPATILIVDDEETLQFFLGEFFREKGFEILLASTGHAALELAEDHWLDLVLLDLRLPDMDGVSVLRRLREQNMDLPVIMVTGFGQVTSAVEAMRLGAYDYLSKPLKLELVEATVNKALESGSLRQEIRRLREEWNAGLQTWIMGDSKAMQPVVFTVERVKRADSSVILQGESGTGKEVVASYLHQQGPRANHRFLAINCAAIPDNLLESELFGYEPGGFTGAKKMKKGLFELADGGTLFLDEIGSMKEDLQAKLLRAIETRSFTRIGGTKSIQIDVRIIAATNRDLQTAMREGTFRQDLYYRLGVFVINLPPLRERKQDIKFFIATFLTEFHNKSGTPVLNVSPEALSLLESYRWPGNIRELRNVIERALILCDGHEITPAHLPQDIAYAATVPLREPVETRPVPEPLDKGRYGRSPLLDPGTGLVASLAEYESRLILETLDRSGGDLAATARELKITPAALRDKLERHKLRA